MCGWLGRSTPSEFVIGTLIKRGEPLIWVGSPLVYSEVTRRDFQRGDPSPVDLVGFTRGVDGAGMTCRDLVVDIVSKQAQCRMLQDEELQSIK
jgi:hypothetical protein